MKRVAIESPYAGDVAKNALYLKWCVIDCLRRGESPYASHGFFTSILDDDIKEHRSTGITAGFEWARLAEIRALYVDLGMSAGMKFGSADARLYGQKIEERRLPPVMLSAVELGIEPGPKCLTSPYDDVNPLVSGEV